MSYAQYESSKHSAKPIQLFKFNFGPLPEDYLRYTNADTDQAFENKPYLRTTISHDNLKQTAGTLDHSAITVRVSRENELTELFRIQPPSYTVTLQIYQGHVGDPDNEFISTWGGRVINAKWEGIALVLTCESVITSLRRAGLRRNYQRNCPHPLYDQEEGSCRAPRVPLNVVCTGVFQRNVISINTVGGDPTAYNNGSIEWVNPAGRREILSVKSATSSGNLSLAGTPVGLSVGTAMRLFKGCDHSMGSRGCGMHNNIVNYGGQPWIPLKNPVNNPF